MKADKAARLEVILCDTIAKLIAGGFEGKDVLAACEAAIIGAECAKGL
jgi:hypothetical protein